MDTSIIFTKTAKGVLELKYGAKNLTGSLSSVLKRVDGQSSIASLLVGLAPAEQQALETALTTLEKQNFIRVFSRRMAPEEVLKIDQEPDESEPLPTLHIEELSPEEGVRAWAEARRGARELVQLGFYATAHLDLDGNVTHRRNVLIVEDDDTIALLMKSYLSRHGFNVKVVGDGQEALNVLDDASVPHLVLLDVNLPNINGFDILAYIRSQENLKNIPAIMVTAQVSDADVLRGLKGGADGYIFKPFEWKALHTCINKVLGIES